MKKYNDFKIAFCSNFINQHVYEFSKAMDSLCDFKFIQSIPMPEEFLQKGYKDYSNEHFVVCTYKTEQFEIDQIINEADVVICGSFNHKLLLNRINQQKITICCSERIYKAEFPKRLFCNPMKFLAFFLQNFFKKSQEFLCLSAYAPIDLFLTGKYINRCLKFGYFTSYTLLNNNFFSRKQTPTLIWVGRFIKWKHPEMFINLMIYLKDKGVNFKAYFIGLGEMENELQNAIIKNKLQSYILYFGKLKNDEVIKKYLESDILIATSDYNEGWGAHVNEAMGNGCAVIASKALGCVPFLIKNKKNGIVFKNKNQKELNKKCFALITDQKKLQNVKMNGYKSIIDLWNGKIAAERLCDYFYESITHHRHKKYKNGPMSKARLKWGYNRQKN